MCVCDLLADGMSGMASVYRVIIARCAQPSTHRVVVVERALGEGKRGWLREIDDFGHGLTVRRFRCVIDFHDSWKEKQQHNFESEV